MADVQLKEKSSLRRLPFYPDDEKRLQALEAKRENPFFEVAFCGHFSAGKSTLLNYLLGSRLLPASPIPTSANIISIQHGPVGLEVINGDEKRFKWEEEIPWDQVKSWGMDGEEIRRMRIYAPLPFLSEQTLIMDTPGVDSTDPRHQRVTVDQLHTADCIVYVSDYNHVQSDTNIRFLKDMANEGKPIILVINQIDKHDDRELKLSTFENGLRATFARAGIKPMRIFFTSMKDPHHPFSQLESFSSFLKPLLFRGRTMCEYNLPMLENGAVNHLIERLTEEKQEAYETWREEVSDHGMSPDEVENYEAAQDTLAYMEEEKREAKQALLEERNQLFKDVTLFPYTTTEKVRSWLESLQKNFKVGWLFTKQKTAEERSRRKQAVLEELNEKVKTQLLFHLKHLLNGVDRAYLSNPEQYEENIQQLSYTVQEELLDYYAPDATFDRNFVYTFTEKVAAAIVKEIKEEAEPLFNEYVAALEKQKQAKKEHLQMKLNEDADDAEKEWQRWLQEKAAFDEKIAACRDFLENQKGGPGFQQRLLDASEKEYPTGKTPEIVVTEEADSMIAALEEEETPLQVSVNEMDDTFVEPLRQYVYHYRERPLLQSEKKKLETLLHQYDENTVTVSLFGAFSAGKSSFINAMLGASILPAAPHPTTSAVNRVEKSNDTYGHGTVLIEMKDESFLQKEIQAVSRELGTELDMDSLYYWNKPNQNSISDYQRTYADYLFTLQQALKKKTAKPGEERQTGLKELHEWVAEEQKACLIKEVTVYYDCPWTTSGLVLVDTPGVNSIHNRHTNVAFEQLRQSNAVLYVTYYNHAFSRADHVFLQQMAKANAQFDANKLIFIINASDLADSEGELQGVKNHVREQLIQNGVEAPRLFALSSKKALEEKQASNEAARQDSFFDFEHYAASITLDELRADHLNRLYQYWCSIHDQLHSVLMALDAGGDRLQQQIQKRYEAAEQLKNSLKDFSVAFILPGLQNELQQQCTYLQERTKLIVQDYFPQSVNPAVLTASTKRKQKVQLLGALQELEGLAESYMYQEQQTIMIRLEEQWKKNVMHQIKQFVLNYKPEELSIELPEDIPSLADKITVQRSGITLDKEEFLSYYQSGRDFFENKKAQQLKEAFAGALQSQASEAAMLFEKEVKNQLEEYVENCRNGIVEHFLKELNEEKERVRWLYDPSRKSDIKEEFDSIHPHVKDCSNEKESI